jgi:hypothetical protein
MGWEGFTAIRYGPGDWALYFDVDDNGLQGVVPDDMTRVEIELVRKERRQERTSNEPAGGTGVDTDTGAKTPENDDDA